MGMHLVKKDIEVDKSLFKRVSSAKKAGKIALPEKVAKVNKHQHNADFVASQKRMSNTKGKESELAADWQRFSDADAINVAKLNSQSRGKSSAHPTASLKSKVDQLTKEAENKKTLLIDLEEQKIINEENNIIEFEIDSFRKKCLVEGLDDIALTLKKVVKIDSFEKNLNKSQPWIISVNV